MLKLKWINPSPIVEEGFNPIPEIHINSAYYTLKSYYKFKRYENYNKITWADPVFFPIVDVDLLVDDIIEADINVLCLSFFVWNISPLNSLAKKVKEKNKNITIIAGGPTLDAHKRLDFFDENEFIDFVVYGDGEEPFVDILDSLLYKTSIPKTMTNVVTKNQKYPFKVFSEKAFWDFSPILDLASDISKDVYKISNLGHRIKFHWEIDRGCPYACSFCDWSSGLHHKVKRRSKFWKDELDFLASLPVAIRSTSANHGIFKEDIEISQYASEHQLNFKPLYMAKLNKDRVWQINRIHAKYNENYHVSISVQDLDKNILGNIDRPDIEWEEHKKYILDFKKDYPLTSMYFETMIGLPGQTLETYKFMLLELDDIGVDFVTGYMWHLLPNSPAYESSYRELHDLKFDDVWFISAQNAGAIGQNVTAEKLQSLYDNNYPQIYKTKMIQSTSSASWKEIAKMSMIVAIYNGIKELKVDVSLRELFKRNSFNENLDKEATNFVDSFENNRIFGIWHDGTWVTLDQYYQKECIINDILS